jgi:glycosyltransferase involved in cell wall biosynthesis
MFPELRQTRDNIFPKPLRAPLGISIIIRTHNSSATLGLVLARLQLKADDDLIVVDSGSIDSTLALAKTYGARIIRTEPPFNYSASLNRGFEEAKNEWVLVISSHTIPEHNDIMTVLRDFAITASPDIVVGYGIVALTRERVHDNTSASAFERIPGGTLSCGAGNTLALYRRHVWLKHQFDTNLTTAEDLEWFSWAIQQGYAGAKVLRAVAVYRNQGSLSHMFRKGWQEVKQAQHFIVGNESSRTEVLVDCVRGFGYFAKLWIFEELPFSSMLRQQSHHLGACLAKL